MGKNEKRDEIIKETTNDLLKTKFIQDLGQKATVDRTAIDNRHMDDLRSVLAEIGQDLQRCEAVPQGMQYVGSLSVHVFKSEILRSAAFATLSNLGSMDFSLADGALRELTGTTLTTFGRSRQKLRSGF